MKYILPILLILVSCKKEESVKPGNTFTITIEDKTLLSGDSLFLSFDYWFTENSGLEFNQTSVNSKYTASGYASDSLHLTKRVYLGPCSNTKEFTFTNTTRLFYRICHYYKIKDQKIWAVSEKGAKSITVQKNGETIFNDNRGGEIVSNMELK